MTVCRQLHLHQQQNNMQKFRTFLQFYTTQSMIRLKMKIMTLTLNHKHHVLHCCEMTGVQYSYPNSCRVPEGVGIATAE